MSENADTNMSRHTKNHVAKIGLSGQKYATFALLPTCRQHVADITSLKIDHMRLITDVRCDKITSSSGETTLELDSHASTCILGRDALITQNYNRPVSILGYNPALGLKTYETVSSAVAYYDDPLNGETYHLVINQAIHVPHLDHHLLCPMQCRVNDMIVNDLPKFLAGSDITDHTHARTIVNPDVPSQTIILPLALWDVISFLNVRMSTHDKWLSGHYKRLHLTSESLEWDPTSSLYEEQELATMTCSGQLARDIAVKGQAPYLVINAISIASLTTDMAAITEDDNFGDVVASYVQIASFDMSSICISSTNTLS
jgi:hypothetical protein